MRSCEGVEQVKGMVADVGTDESGQSVASMSASGYVPMGKTHRCGGQRPDKSVGVSGMWSALLSRYRVGASVNRVSFPYRDGMAEAFVPESVYFRGVR